MLFTIKTILSEEQIQCPKLTGAIAEWAIFSFAIGYLTTELLIINPVISAYKMGVYASVIAVGIAIILRISVVKRNFNILFLGTHVWILLAVRLIPRLLIIS